MPNEALKPFKPSGDGNPEFVIAHPEAELDPERARTMAYLSNIAELQVVEGANDAVKAAQLGLFDVGVEAMDSAKSHRIAADADARVGGDIYDQAQRIKRGNNA